MSPDSTPIQPAVPHHEGHVPVSGLVEQAEQLAQEINGLSEEADRISVLNPLNILHPRRIEAKRAALAPEVSQKLREALGGLRDAVGNVPEPMPDCFKPGPSARRSRPLSCCRINGICWSGRLIARRR